MIVEVSWQRKLAKVRSERAGEWLVEQKSHQLNLQKSELW